MSEYLVVIKGKPAGPYSLEQLKEMKIRPGTFIKRRGMDDYKEAHEIPELGEMLGFETYISKPQYYGGLEVRLLAMIIDNFFIFIAYCILATIVVLFIDEKQLRIVVSLSGLALIPIIKFIYSVMMESSSRQATYGKILLGLKISNESGAPIGFGAALVRNLGKLLSAGLLGLGYLFGFFNKKQQCLHDMIAGTVVIRDRLID